MYMNFLLHIHMHFRDGVTFLSMQNLQNLSGEVRVLWYVLFRFGLSEF